jgi:hypothetical protein
LHTPDLVGQQRKKAAGDLEDSHGVATAVARRKPLGLPGWRVSRFMRLGFQVRFLKGFGFLPWGRRDRRNPDPPLGHERILIRVKEPILIVPRPVKVG